MCKCKAEGNRVEDMIIISKLRSMLGAKSHSLVHAQIIFYQLVSEN